jgi:LDH2 family malate/lactate/ureidoglycolate dehydrogenase
MNASFTAIALDISAFTELDEFEKKAAQWVTSLTQSPRRAGVDQLYYPGQRAGLTKQERLRSGIPVDDYTRNMLVDLAKEFHIDLPIINK